MADLDLDGSELLKLAEEIGADAHKVAEGAYPLVKQYAESLRNDWRDNARSTARRHGKHYPRAITAEQEFSRTDVIWEVGPESQRKQGDMGRGFEFGGAHQPPHWDMSIAVTGVEPKFNKAVDDLARSFLS
ncbi:hypothetical protein IMZ11_02325 [Microtetraspora sp. AC03309]|uniref:hypothetical protein n=1 Tax=Microtetraspora sp. AC03309 TaxID=2779376 RepID=UPI001E399463|nr:hypothetical protein [Microtetraspora sp. AC03309]MCC5574477.1 hypothetical protein [Microtetraspora sp. AC03309]